MIGEAIVIKRTFTDFNEFLELAKTQVAEMARECPDCIQPHVVIWSADPKNSELAFVPVDLSNEIEKGRVAALLSQIRSQHHPYIFVSEGWAAYKEPVSEQEDRKEILTLLGHDGLIDHTTIAEILPGRELGEWQEQFEAGGRMVEDEGDLN